MKIKGKLITGFTALLIVTAAVSAAGFIGMRELSESAVIIYEEYMRSTLYAGDAAAHLNRMRIENRNAILNSSYDDSKAATDSLSAFERYVEDFRLIIESSREIAASGEHLIFHDRVIELFDGNYLPRARENMSAAIADIPDHHNELYINAQLASADFDAEQIENLLQGIADLSLALANQSVLDNAWLTRIFSLVLLSLLIFAFLLAVTVLILIIRSLNKKPKKISFGTSAKTSESNTKVRENAVYKEHIPADDFDDISNGRFIAPDARVLIVDDTHADLKAAEVLMRPYNIKTDLVNSGVAAIQALQFGRYDMVFIDHKMPGMDGADTAGRIRMMGKTELPLIVLTDNTASDMMESFSDYGFNDFLSKPISTLILDTLLRKWIPRSKRRYMP